MNVIEIPFAPGVPRQRQTTTLDGRRYEFTFDWNARIERWFFDLSTEGGIYLYRAKGLAVRADTLRQIRHLPEAPPGTLTLVDLTGADQEPGLYDIGKTHLILYVDTTEDTTEDEA